MPSVASKPIDWDYAFLLYSQGQTYPEIAAATGAGQPAIRSRASRHEWRNKVTIARHTVQQMQQKKVESLTERGEQWQNREANGVIAVTDVLEQIPIPTKIKPLREYVELRSAHGKHGRATFGLDQQTQAVQVNIGLFGQGDVQEKPVEPVIDVASTLHNPEQST